MHNLYKKDTPDIDGFVSYEMAAEEKISRKTFTLTVHSLFKQRQGNSFFEINNIIIK